ncbi:hypothetical protein PtB15_18B193 [Puccinia triticina]|nr:hypothetical protein PtB15_18B193 [Puccinia triticina]
MLTYRHVLSDRRTILDDEANPCPILEALVSLAEASSDVTIYLDHHRPGKERLVALPTDELDTLKDLLRQMETCLLPSLKQQLSDLAESLDLNSVHGSGPTGLDTLEIISQLRHTLEAIDAARDSIGRIAENRLKDVGEYDRDYGDLKLYRSCHLRRKLDELMSDYVWELLDYIGQLSLSRSKITQIDSYGFPIYLIKEWAEKCSTRSSDAIDHIIKSFKQSDFCTLQDSWRKPANDLNLTLADLSRLLGLIDRLEQEDSAKDEDPSDSNSSSHAPEHSQDQENSSDSEQTTAESWNEDENISSDSNSTIENEDDRQSDASLSTDSRRQTTFTRHPLMILAKSIIPLAKLIRIFINKLSSPPTNKPQFTIGTKMSSAEINSVYLEIRCLYRDITALLRTLFGMFHDDAPINHIKDVEDLREQVRKKFDSSLILLCSYLVPLNPDVDSPPAGNHSKSWFLTLKQQFLLADHNFGIAIFNFKRDFPM